MYLLKIINIYYILLFLLERYQN